MIEQAMDGARAGPGPRTSQQIVTELHLLLVHAQVSDPYILVGHSLGGLHMSQYAYHYPQEVAGMVLLDATSSFTSRTH
jgi:pimeloyl-ACP methyl ester carboxylesterase